MAANENGLDLEKGLLANVQKYSAVFERIFLKFDRHFEENEEKGKSIDFENDSSIDKYCKSRPKMKVFDNRNSTSEDISDACVEFDEPDDVIITGIDRIDPELAAELHKKVVLIKEEINWSDGEEENISAEDTLDVQEELSASSDYDDDDNSNYDTEAEADISMPSPNSPSLDSPLQTTSSPIPRQPYIQSQKVVETTTLMSTCTASDSAISDHPSPPEPQATIPCDTTPPFYQQTLSYSPSPFECFSCCSCPHHLQSTPCINSYEVCAMPNPTASECPYVSQPHYMFPPCFDCCEQPSSSHCEQFNIPVYGANMDCCDYYSVDHFASPLEDRREQRLALSAEFNPLIKRH